MIHSAVDNGTVHASSNLSSRNCPRCACHLTRIHRRFIDRLLSLFLPVYRYRCDRLLCDWEGNIRVNHRPERHTKI